ncbi:fimbrial protein, partial [Salmonella enterica]|nr:fimbrial protein [Salmonella enterica]
MNINLINCALLGAGKEGADTTKADVTFDSSAVDTTDTNLLATTFSTEVTDVGIRLLTSEDNSLKLGIS